MSVKSRILDEGRRKGYTSAYLCTAFNSKFGLNLHINVFIRAVSNNKRKSAREEWITDQTIDMIRELPNIAVGSNDFVKRAKAKGLTLTRVWEHYNATREHKYSYSAFARAVHHPVCPYERRLAEEADACLAELAQ